MLAKIILIIYSMLIFIHAVYSLPTIAVRGKCTPGELVFVQCNLCTCSPKGEPNQVCAEMWCPPDARVKHLYPNPFQKFYPNR
ncbi:unnamed protein product [Bemisia tabaci]|uniref:Pacifastin domain-containing protein n=2 Tax=Bemisia tabaci TaxID=7038 RepID=A0A9P0A1L9_BEMTA|nr:unnamed protein product [Bemisia tabaci]